MRLIKRYVKNKSGHKQLNLTIDPFAFVLNSVAMGDVIAAAPVIKYMVDNYYFTPDSYTVVAKKAFREIFPFIPDANFRDFDMADPPLWGIDSNTPMATLNTKATGTIVRNTPKAMHLSHFASIKLADRIIPLPQLNYIPLNQCDVSRFGVDFKRAVILITTYRDETRMWHSKDILDLAAWIKRKGLIPVFVGKTNDSKDLNKEIDTFTSLPDDVGEFGVDLRNQTTIAELATIMQQSKAVCGVDSGPIHLAGTTTTPIVCGYPTVAAEYRTPTRPKGKTYSITPHIECANCETHWRTSYHNFEKCFLGHANCCKEFTADRYAKHLEKIL